MSERTSIFLTIAVIAICLTSCSMSMQWSQVYREAAACGDPAQ